MANFTVSPGAKLNEIDNTFLTSQPVQAGAAIIGPTVKGSVLIPTKVTSYSEYTTMFGDVVESGSRNYSYLTSIAAYNYFNYGGTSLLVTRVVTGSYTSATSSITNEVSTTPFVLETLGEGDLMNTGTDGTGGALSTGTKDNVRWQISSPNTASGTFNVLIRRGDDINNKTIVLESFNGVSLDPNSEKYIAKIIGDQKQNYDSVNNQLTTTGSYTNASRFVRVKSVGTPTLNYLDSNGVAKDAYTGSIPLSSTGSFNGAEGTPFPARAGQFYQNINATDSQGLTGDNYTTAISLLSNSETYQFNVLFTPGLTDESHNTEISSLITNTQNRGDNLLVFDTTNYGSTITTAIGEANSRDTSYAATYWPWVRISDPSTGKLVFVPASTMIPGVYAFNDKVAAPWFAPAGINRGGLSTVVSAEYKLSQGNRDSLYESNINPLATLPRTGVVVYGQKTLQKQASALDRVNVRRLLIELKNYISQIAETVVFEQNTIVTRGSFLAKINPYLEGIQQKQGLYAFQVKMDDANN